MHLEGNAVHLHAGTCARAAACPSPGPADTDMQQRRTPCAVSSLPRSLLTCGPCMLRVLPSRVALSSWCWDSTLFVETMCEAGGRGRRARTRCRARAICWFRSVGALRDELPRALALGLDTHCRCWCWSACHRAGTVLAGAPHAHLLRRHVLPAPPAGRQ